MSRSVKKGPFVEARLLGRVQEMNKKNERKVVKTWSRASVIFPDFIGHTIAVYNGRKHVPGLRHREHGRPPARRVRPDPHLPRARASRPTGPRPCGRGARSCAFPPPPSTSAAPPARPDLVTSGHPRAGRVEEARRAPAVHAAGRRADVARVLKSATANAENNHNLSADDLVVVEARANEGPTIKRWRPRAQGRAFPIHKPHDPHHRRPSKTGRPERWDTRSTRTASASG